MAAWFLAGWPVVLTNPHFPPKIAPVYAASETFTTSGTWTAPAGVTSVTVEVWGGGGAGGGAIGNPSTGGGGAGGAYARSVLSVVPGNDYIYAVGAGKAGNTSNSQAQNAGNPSWFDSTGTLFAQGGQGGAPGPSNSTNGAAGIGSASSSIGDVVYAGGSGSVGNFTAGSGFSGAGGGGAGSNGAGGNASSGTGGTGATDNGGNGADGVGNNSTGNNGANYGAGGSGGKANNNPDRAGGDGAQGLVRITYTVPPSITVATTDSPDPVNVPNSVTFAATATDSEEDNWYLAVCKTDSITAGAPPSCEASQTYCVSSSAAASGAQNTCSWTSDGTGEQNWYAFACNSLSCSSADTANSPITVNESAIISVVITSDALVTYGILSAGTSQDTTASGLNDTQTAQNDGTVTETFNIRSQNTACPWTLAASAGSEQYAHDFSTNGGSVWTPMTTSYQTLATGVTVSGTQTFDLRITPPTATSCYDQQSADVTIQAIQN